MIGKMLGNLETKVYDIFLSQAVNYKKVSNKIEDDLVLNHLAPKAVMLWEYLQEKEITKSNPARLICCESLVDMIPSKIDCVFDNANNSVQGFLEYYSSSFSYLKKDEKERLRSKFDKAFAGQARNYNNLSISTAANAYVSLIENKKIEPLIVYASDHSALRQLIFLDIAYGHLQEDIRDEITSPIKGIFWRVEKACKAIKKYNDSRRTSTSCSYRPAENYFDQINRFSNSIIETQNKMFEPLEILRRKEKHYPFAENKPFGSDLSNPITPTISSSKKIDLPKKPGKGEKKLKPFRFKFPEDRV